MWQFIYSAKPPLKLVPGARYRKHGETMDWGLVAFTDDEVTLSGPGYLRGMLRVELADFNREWSRV